MRRRGFTLIELSIVLVIIGLLAGAVLAGQDLIHAAEVRAQITQIEKYNSATNTFRDKFGGIPGDLQLTLASQFGFNTYGCDGISQGSRNGDGLIDIPGSSSVGLGYETSSFWMDLSRAKMIEMQPMDYPMGCQAVGNHVTAALHYIIPFGKIGDGTYVYVYETSGANWFALSAVTQIAVGLHIDSGTGIPVMQAYRIDSKIDDGLPQSGNVQAVYVNYLSTQNAPNNTTAGGDSTTCYDTTTGAYSVTINSGNGPNCALSFKMQGAGP